MQFNGRCEVLGSIPDSSIFESSQEYRKEENSCEPSKIGTDFPVKFKGGNAGQVDTGRLRTSNLEVAGSIPDSSIFRFRF